VLYFSNEVKLGPKRKVGANKFLRRFTPELGPHFQFASYAPGPFWGEAGLAGFPLSFLSFLPSLLPEENAWGSQEQALWGSSVKTLKNSKYRLKRPKIRIHT